MHIIPYYQFFPYMIPRNDKNDDNENNNKICNDYYNDYINDRVSIIFIKMTIMMK